jgi:hypothetical protein
MRPSARMNGNVGSRSQRSPYNLGSKSVGRAETMGTDFVQRRTLHGGLNEAKPTGALYLYRTYIALPSFLYRTYIALPSMWVPTRGPGRIPAGGQITGKAHLDAPPSLLNSPAFIFSLRRAMVAATCQVCAVSAMIRRQNIAKGVKFMAIEAASGHLLDDRRGGARSD